MNGVESIKKNYVLNVAYQVLLFATQLITAPYLSRVLGSEGIGINSYTNSVVTYFILFASLGTASYGQREVAMHRDDKNAGSLLFWEIELLSVTTTAIATLAWIVWLLVSVHYTGYYVALTINVISVAFDISWYFAAFEKYRYIVIRNAVVRIAGMALTFIFIKSSNDLMLYIIICAITGLVGNLSMWTYLPGMLTRIDRRMIHPFRRHLKQTFMYFIPTIATSVYTVLDKTMIGIITGSENENGYYEQATKVIKAAETLLFSLNNVMYTRQSYLFSIGKINEIKDKINKSFEYLFAVAIAIMFGLCGIASNFVPWFFGRGYEPVIRLLWLMSPLPLVIAISNVLGNQYLSPSGQRVRSTWGIIAGAVTNFISNMLLIPRYGADGATVASVIAEFVISFIYVRMSRGYVSWRQLGKIAGKKIIAGVVMFLTVWILGRGHSGNFIITIVQIIAAASVYIIMLMLLHDRFALAMMKQVKEKMRHGKSQT